jgi:hypothetical protein
MQERQLNRSEQGDVGEAAAVEWFTRAGATVSVPLGHSPDYDLLADFDGRPLRVQVKTSVCTVETPGRHKRWTVLVSTRGGNRSWTGLAKLLDRDRIDLLFVPPVMIGGG